MKVLWIAPFLPYDKVDHAGGKVLNYYINSLCDKSAFDVRFIGFSKPAEYKHFTLDKKIQCYIGFYHDHGIKKIARNCYDLYSLKCPLDKNGNITTSYLKLCILRQLKKLKKGGYVPDIIILEWTQVIVFVNDIKKVYSNSKVVGIEEDVSIQAFLRKYENAKGRIHKAVTKMRYNNITKTECGALNACDLVILNNEKDRAILRKLNIRPNIKMWASYYDRIEVQRTSNPKKNILFFGDMSRPENSEPAKWLIDEVYPLVRNLGIELVILGGNPSEELKSKATDTIHVTGFVKDIEPYLSSSLCLVAPLVLGAGIKIKVLTCMAAGIPVCTNDVGIEGIPAEDGKHYLHCKDKEEYASAIKRLFEDERLAGDIADNACKLMDEKFNYQKTGEEFAKWLIELAR
ncbi:glycosyltransferase [Butyrivibrio sp. M55]|uniref:glycosyltransferase n=1 Tax=Butyrivibrio sp. M55 TaxID=1855323 RepID=UPI0008E6BB8E|nr:glycosyltransferase family 4 protein [Butyrivibrio sp. M55]SFU85245.1 Glycosyl transferases group 1 [Butyrivibrio sp. M55]